MRFFNALIAGDMAIQKVVAFVKRDASSAQETIQPSSAYAGRNPSTSNAVRRQSLANYKGCMVYKELQKSFFHYLLVLYY